jgi:hypothetical protein
MAVAAAIFRSKNTASALLDYDAIADAVSEKPFRSVESAAELVQAASGSASPRRLEFLEVV